MKKFILLAVIIIVAIFAYYYYFGSSINDKGIKLDLFSRGSGMTITSTAFKNYSKIPTQYTCDGADVNPPLIFSNVSVDAKSLALTVEDPDAGEEFTHWVLFNIQPQSSGIAENTLDATQTQGMNDFGTKGYAGPCPTTGQHHYVFTLYALSDYVTLPEGATKKELLSKIQDVVIKTSTLTGVYKKQ